METIPLVLRTERQLAELRSKPMVMRPATPREVLILAPTVNAATGVYSAALISSDPENQLVLGTDQRLFCVPQLSSAQW